MHQVSGYRRGLCEVYGLCGGNILFYKGKVELDNYKENIDDTNGRLNESGDSKIITKVP